MSRKVFITGVSSGVGKGLADYYLSHGAQVFGLSRRGYGKNHENFQEGLVDLGNIDALPLELEKLNWPDEPFDITILNAGILPGIKDMKDTSVGELRKTMDVNVWSNKVIIDFLTRKDILGPLCVSMSSGFSIQGPRGWSGYSISKAALNMMVQLYAKENASCKFIAYAPGVINSAMQQGLSNIPSTSQTASVKSLIAAREANAMPDPATFAKAFDRSLRNLSSYRSGSFVDISEL
mmetsp:Transcript_3995/g.4619  ORF Transcript_3995/g.4619 Transcript_3995/m.4619 type:complete len:236 (+) Transcript_3995:134-841(+)